MKRFLFAVICAMLIGGAVAADLGQLQMIEIAAYVLVAAFILLDLWLAIGWLEYFVCAVILRQPPFVACTRKMCRVVSDQILTYYPDAKTVCEIGSGHGGLARHIARRAGVRVDAVENMPFSVFVSRVSCALFGWRCRTIWADAFEWLARPGVSYDIGVAYLGPTLTPRLAKYKKKFRVFISLDFELPGLVPVRVIDMGAGYTRYKNKMYPHRLFVYEFHK